MANIFEFNGYRPVIHESSFVHPNATVTGNVTIGANVYIGPSAALRGDWGEIIIAYGCNIQENCTVHMFPGQSVILEEAAHVGHGAVIHGAHLKRNCLIGMNAVIMDRVIVGENSIVGALSFVPEGMEIPARKIAAGNPARLIKDITDEMISWKTHGTELYQRLPAELYATLKPCKPLRHIYDKPLQQNIYQTWDTAKKNKGEK